jgi:tol-pal system protein YbgF
MRWRFPGYALLLAGVAMAVGCAIADTGSFERLQNEMVAMKKDMAALKAAQQGGAIPSPTGAGSADQGDIQALRKNYADLNNDFDRVKSDMLASTTKMDEARGEMQRIANRQNELDKAAQEVRGNAERVRELDKRMAAVEEKLSKLSGAPVPAPAAAGDSRSEWKSPEEMYEYAVGQVKGGDPRKGRETLAAFAAKYPGHKLTPNVLYWKGEAFYAEKDYENAILAFQDVVDKYPSGEKAPDAMYKQGLSFLALNDRKNARVLLELVSSKYPRSKASEQAKKKLAEIR